MYFDLNFPVPPLPTVQSNKGKGKQVQPSHSPLFTPAQLAAIEARVDLLVHCAHSLVVIPSDILISRV
jgi:ribonuclease P/MRP protein subunit RPP1